MARTELDYGLVSAERDLRASTETEMYVVGATGALASPAGTRE